MSAILYYSNFCDFSKKIIKLLSSCDTSKELHFICIDKRINENGKTYILLEKNQKIVLPNTITKVPALMLIKENYKILYGDDIYNYIAPKQTAKQSMHSTQSHFEPFSFDSGSSVSGISSDTFSFLDMNDTDLGTKGHGGLRQMHNYVSLTDSNNLGMNLPVDDPMDGKSSGNKTMEQMLKQREQDVSGIIMQQKQVI